MANRVVDFVRPRTPICPVADTPWWVNIIGQPTQNCGLAEGHEGRSAPESTPASSRQELVQGRSCATLTYYGPHGFRDYCGHELPFPIGSPLLETSLDQVSALPVRSGRLSLGKVTDIEIVPLVATRTPSGADCVDG